MELPEKATQVSCGNTHTVVLTGILIDIDDYYLYLFKSLEKSLSTVFFVFEKKKKFFEGF